MVEQITSKKCSKCKQIKPVSEFHRDHTKKDGFHTQCKICVCKKVIKYRKTPKGRLSARKAARKYYNSEKGGVAIREHAKKYKLSLKPIPRSNRKFGDGRKPSRPVKNLTSREWRDVYEFVENEAKDSTPFFYRRQKTDELIIKLLMLDISIQQVINLNNEDMPFFHGEPHIVTRNPKNHEIREYFIPPALETKIKAYHDEFRQGTTTKQSFLAVSSGNRLSYDCIYRKLMGTSQKGYKHYQLGIGRKLGIENLTPACFKHTLREQQRGKQAYYKKEKIVWALPFTKLIATNVELPKDDEGKPDKEKVAEVKALIINAHKRRILNPPLPDPIGGRRGQRYKYNYPVLKVRRCWPKWQKLPGLEDLQPLTPLRKVNKNIS